MAGDWFTRCPVCGVTYYGVAGHACSGKGTSGFYDNGNWWWNGYQWIITYPGSNPTASFGAIDYTLITKEEYKRLLEDSRQLQEIRRLLGWNINK